MCLTSSALFFSTSEAGLLRLRASAKSLTTLVASTRATRDKDMRHATNVDRGVVLHVRD